MTISVIQLRRLGAACVEIALVVFLVGLVISTTKSHTGMAATRGGNGVGSGVASIAGAGVQLPAGGTICIQDDSNTNFLTFNATDGSYTFTGCTPAFTLSGVGQVVVKGCTVTLQDVKPDRRVLAKVDLCLARASASAQVYVGGVPVKTIMDRNTTNDTCGCAVAPPPAGP